MKEFNKPLNASKNSTPPRHDRISSGSSAGGRNAVSRRFPSKLRVKSRDDFSNVFQHGKVAADTMLVVHAIRASGMPTRLGLSISKKVGNAPKRNRWKRLIREAFRIHHHRLPAGLTIVVRPRRGASPEFHRIEVSLQDLLHKLERRRKS